MITRRQLLKTGAAAGAAVLAPWRFTFAAAEDGRPALARFVDPLPLPAALQPTGVTPDGLPLYEVAMTEFAQKLHRDLTPTTVWGYGGSYPGPTIEALAGQPIAIRWVNGLPPAHLLPIDHTLHGADGGDPDVRTVVHLHGGHVPPEADGYPEAWFTPGGSATYIYPNAQQAAPLWYHDHALGITRLNVYAGLAGLYLIRDGVERRLPLPKGRYEVPLVIQDRTFDTSGELWYPPENEDRPGTVWVPEFFGDTILVNGKVWPYLRVEQRKYRFRIYNGSNARFYGLRLSSGQPFHQIGTDGGLLPAPVELTEILLAPAERADVVVDFAGMEGARIVLTNDAREPFPDGDEIDPRTTGRIMQFRVDLPLRRKDRPLPSTLRDVPRLGPARAARTRDMTLVEILDEEGIPLESLLNGMHWDDPVTDKPRLGDVEVWRLINTTGDAHPIHLHLVMFQVLDRRPFDVAAYDERDTLDFTGPRVPRAPNEAGWKDTVRADPGYVTRIITRFDGFTGTYPWHCHILEHEDNEMMSRFEVVP